MDHSEAVTKKMAESYLLEELTPEQRDAFEEHYFDCPECAKDVKAAAMLVANVKEVLRAEPEFQPAREPERAHAGWFSWLQPAYGLAAALVLAVVLYQNLVTIPGLKEQAKGNVPQAVVAFTLLPQMRGANSKVVQAEPKQSFVLYIDIPPSDNFASYTCVIQSEDGTQQFPVQVSAEAAKQPVLFSVPSSLLKPGKYVVVLRGNRKASDAPEAGTEIRSYPFSFEYKNGGTTKP